MEKITKENKGITLISLIITIILMLILVSVTAYTGIDSFKNAKVTKFVTSMQLIQTKVDEVAGENNLDEGQVLTQEQRSIISSAFSNGEIEANAFENFRYFSKEDILNLFESLEDLDIIDAGILINFETREVVSLEGIEYEGKRYYTQYNLPNGQKLNNNSSLPDRNTSFTLSQEMSGLNCNVTVSEINIKNATLILTEIDLNENEISKQTITNYVEKDSYSVTITKSGTYKFILQDNTNGEKIFESDELTITLVNSPKTNADLTYNYSFDLDSENWAYDQKDDSDDWYVWIPRFAYKLNEDTGEIEIKFVKGNSNIATDNTYVGDWEINSKFDVDNETKLTGLWVKLDSNTEKIEIELDELIEFLETKTNNDDFEQKINHEINNEEEI